VRGLGGDGSWTHFGQAVAHAVSAVQLPFGTIGEGFVELFIRFAVRFS
jgi:hypothetical protein